MFKKLKQRIEEDNQSVQKSTIRSSTPKKNTKHFHHNNVNSRIISNGDANMGRENKWERRRISSASLYSSRESLLSIDSAATATLSKVSYNESSSIGTPSDSPFATNNYFFDVEEGGGQHIDFRDVGSQEELLTEISRKSDHIKKLENKINDMATAFMDQSRQRDRLEEALENIRNEMHNRTEISVNDSLKVLREDYERKLLEKDRQVKEYIQKHQQDSNRFSDVKELNELQQEEVAKMKGMLIHSQTEMSKKAAELMEKSKQIANLDRAYSEQKLELEGMQERLDELSRDRTKYEMQEKQFCSQVTTLQKEKSALKSQLSNLIDELTMKSSELDAIQLSGDRSHEEVISLRQTYNLYKAKAVSDIDERDAEIVVLKERLSDLEQRLEDSKLSETGQLNAVEKERLLLEKRLRDTREQLSELRTQSNDKITTLGSLVSSLDEKVKEKIEYIEKLESYQASNNKSYDNKIQGLEKQLLSSENTSKFLKNDTLQINELQAKLKEKEQRILGMKTEKMELEIVADRSSFLEAQNKLLDTRFKETVERLEKDRSSLEEKVRELQCETRKNSYRQEHTSKRKMDTLETKVKDQERQISQYQERLEELVEEKDTLLAELSLKEDESKDASACLEDAMSRTNDLKNEISNLEQSLKEKDNIIMYIKESSDGSAANNSIDSLLREELNSLRETFNNREQELIERDEEIEELRYVIQARDDELATVSQQLRDFQENNKMLSRARHNASHDKDLQKTVARLTLRIQELEKERKEMISNDFRDDECDIENRSLRAELDESQKKIRSLHQNISDLKKHFQREKTEQRNTNEDCSVSTDSENSKDRDFLEVNFKYLKHVVLKYMCSANEQSRQLVAVIGHLLQFSSREMMIVKDCFDWKVALPEMPKNASNVKTKL